MRVKEYKGIAILFGRIALSLSLSLPPPSLSLSLTHTRRILTLLGWCGRREVLDELKLWEKEFDELVESGCLRGLDQSTNQDLTDMSERHHGLLPQGARESVFYSKYNSKLQVPCTTDESPTLSREAARPARFRGRVGRRG